METNWYPIKGHPHYFVNEFGHFLYQFRTGKNKVVKRQIYPYAKGKIKLRVQGGSTLVFFTEELMALSELPKAAQFFKRTSGEGRQRLDKHRYLELSTRFTPDVHLAPTPNEQGEYAATKDQLNMGVQVCQSCGYPQPVELRLCKNCNDIILFPSH